MIREVIDKRKITDYRVNIRRNEAGINGWRVLILNHIEEGNKRIAYNMLKQYNRRIFNKKMIATALSF